LVAVGLGFLVAALVQKGAADTYVNARECPDTTSPNCYQLSPGTIRSVSVSQTRSGEQDTAVIETRDTTVTVILEPAASDASHIRTGAAVNVKWYQGKVTLVGVDSIGVPSRDNPASQQSQYWNYGIFFLAFGGLSVLLQVWLRRRRARRAAVLAGDGMTPGALLQPTIVLSGESGWIVKPRLNSSAAIRLGVGCLAVVVLTLRALEDPARTATAAALDAAVIGIGGLVLVAALRNSKVIAHGREITRINWLGRASTYPISEILHADRFRSGASRYLVFAGRDGHQLFRIAGIHWDYHQLDQMCRESRIDLVGGYGEIVGALGVNKRAKASGYGLTTIAQLAALTAIVIVFVVLLSGPASR
jgi:hypothetical protein